MTGKILVLGAAGRLGFAAAEAFREARWQVRGLVRPKRTFAAPRGIEVVEAYTREEAVEAARGCDVVLNAFNPAITEWRDKATQLAHSAIATAEENGATFIFPGSVWNYGETMPPLLDEATPVHPSTMKGRLRVEIETRIEEACERGMRAIVLRAGDFYGAGVGSWFDLVVVKDLGRQRLTYPGPLDVVHPWAYLPDYVDTLVTLAERRSEFKPYETFGFPGHAVTGREMIAAIEAITRATYNVSRMRWWMIKSFGQIFRMGRALGELEYLWRVPHRLSGDKLKAALGDVPHTPFDKAVRTSLRVLGYRV
ncbi:MAG: NAD-dependent epimerase/dehydratase family protein [Alphaproteobacteria bacterium]|nr:NAD-dependent epimerase/dehydratase family protein [Alphaproteobacteria bacterium]